MLCFWSRTKDYEAKTMRFDTHNTHPGNTTTRASFYSYETLVAQIAGGNLELFSQWHSSATTLRHVREFLKQNGFKADTLEQMRKDYEA